MWPVCPATVDQCNHIQEASINLDYGRPGTVCNVKDCMQTVGLTFGYPIISSPFGCYYIAGIWFKDHCTWYFSFVFMATLYKDVLDVPWRTIKYWTKHFPYLPCIFQMLFQVLLENFSGVNRWTEMVASDIFWGMHNTLHMFACSPSVPWHQQYALPPAFIYHPWHSSTFHILRKSLKAASILVKIWYPNSSVAHSVPTFTCFPQIFVHALQRSPKLFTKWPHVYQRVSVSVRSSQLPYLIAKVM